MVLSISGLVFGSDNLRLLSPNHAIAVGTSDDVFLVIDRAEHNISRDTDGQDSDRGGI